MSLSRQHPAKPQPPTLPFFSPEELKGLLYIITSVLTRANWSFVTEEKPSLISKVKTSVGGTWVYLTGG